MAGSAFGFAHKQVKPAYFLRVHCCFVSPHVFIKTAVQRYQAAHIRTYGVHDLKRIYCPPVLFRESSGEHLAVSIYLPKSFAYLFHTAMHFVFILHHIKCLVFQRAGSQIIKIAPGCSAALISVGVFLLSGLWLLITVFFASPSVKAFSG